MILDRYFLSTVVYATEEERELLFSIISSFIKSGLLLKPTKTYIKTITNKGIIKDRLGLKGKKDIFENINTILLASEEFVKFANEFCLNFTVIDEIGNEV